MADQILFKHSIPRRDAEDNSARHIAYGLATQIALERLRELRRRRRRWLEHSRRGVTRRRRYSASSRALRPANNENVTQVIANGRF
ncbi:hypothetical protein [Arthrobacter flavus]|uniref:Uncharacterized protein n=1 Tax=Arthrobacter flavus TaxID=95172 RepID=A0ABW4Q9W0_9MICC